MNVPAEFRDRISRHNRHALTASFLCALGALGAWMLAYGLGMGLTLAFLTIVKGQSVIRGEELVTLPPGLPIGAGIVAMGLLAWAWIDARRRRFRPVDDRPVIGWHLAADVLLAPARLTFGIAENLRALIFLDRQTLEEAFAILGRVLEDGKVPAMAFGSEFPDPRRLRKALAALLLTGCLDLHHGERESFYVVPSDEKDRLRELFADTDEPS